MITLTIILIILLGLAIIIGIALICAAGAIGAIGTVIIFLLGDVIFEIVLVIGIVKLLTRKKKK